MCTCPPVSRGSVSIPQYQSLNLTGGNPSPGKGESGISLRYHTHKELLDLNKDQRIELSEWTKANGGKKKGGGKQKGDSSRGSGAAKIGNPVKSILAAR